MYAKGFRWEYYSETVIKVKASLLSKSCHFDTKMSSFYIGKPLYIANCNKLYVIQTTSPVPRTELVPATRPLSESRSLAVIYRTFGDLFDKHTTRSHIPLPFFRFFFLFFSLYLNRVSKGTHFFIHAHTRARTYTHLGIIQN